MYLGYFNSDKKTGNPQLFLFYHSLFWAVLKIIFLLGFKSRSIVKKKSDVMGKFFLIWIDIKTENIKMHYYKLTRKMYENLIEMIHTTLSISLYSYIIEHQWPILWQVHWFDIFIIKHLVFSIILQSLNYFLIILPTILFNVNEL